MMSSTAQMTNQSSQLRLKRKLSLAVLGTIDHTAAIKPSIVSSVLVSMPAGFISDPTFRNAVNWPFSACARSQILDFRATYAAFHFDRPRAHYLMHTSKESHNISRESALE
ncbi:hypothetical protein D9M71_815170 [compost metagenome]